MSIKATGFDKLTGELVADVGEHSRNALNMSLLIVVSVAGPRVDNAQGPTVRVVVRIGKATVVTKVARLGYGAAARGAYSIPILVDEDLCQTVRVTASIGGAAGSNTVQEFDFSCGE